MTPISEEAVVAARVFSELPVGETNGGKEPPAPIGRHHPVFRTMKDEQRNGQGRRLSLNSIDRRGYFSREPSRAAAMEKGIRQHRIYYRRISGQS